ncbi:MAG: LAGLIDADG family homing endonuclease [Candidatus Aenigmatarchaeota archaeon]
MRKLYGDASLRAPHYFREKIGEMPHLIAFNECNSSMIFQYTNALPLFTQIIAPTTFLGFKSQHPQQYGGGVFMSVVGINNMSKEGERQRYLPLEIRLQMYDDVIELRKQGLTYKDIQRKIYEKYGMQLPQSTINDWINRRHKPLRNVNIFDGKPSPKLSFIIGVIFSDGSKRFDGKGYRLRLGVIDKEFAEEFGKALAKVLGKKEPYKPFWNKSRKEWVVEIYSILLYKFLDRPLEELKPYIEHSKKTVSAFLRALFDGEGSMYKYRRKLIIYNTNKELLNYVKYLLKKYFNIDATGPHLAIKSGKVVHFPNEKITKTTKDYYYLYTCTNSLFNFYKYIGFTIKRKQQNLIKAIKQ